MAGQAVATLIDVIRDLAVVLVGVRWVVLVAVQAGEVLEVRWVGMAGSAGRPFPLMLPRKDGEVVPVVVEVCTVPGRDHVAGQTTGGIVGTRVLPHVIRLVTGHTIILVGWVEKHP